MEKETKKTTKLLNPVMTLAAGLALGAVSRLLDIFTQNLGNIFSQMAVWILLGTLIAIYSETARKAMANILPFSLGVLVTYYTAAVITEGIYSGFTIRAWTVFAFCTPALGFTAWHAKEPGPAAKAIGACIVLAAFITSVVIYDGPRIYDLIIDGILIYILFFRKIRR